MNALARAKGERTNKKAAKRAKKGPTMYSDRKIRAGFSSEVSYEIAFLLITSRGLPFNPALVDERGGKLYATIDVPPGTVQFWLDFFGQDQSFESLGHVIVSMKGMI